MKIEHVQVFLYCIDLLLYLKNNNISCVRCEDAVCMLYESL
jgi:hypothetical protein